MLVIHVTHQTSKLSELTIVGEERYTSFLSKYRNIIEEEINVKQVYFQENAGESVRYEVKLNFLTAGPKLGKQLGPVQKELQQLNDEEAKKVVEQGYFDTKTQVGDSLRVEKGDLLINQTTRQETEMALNEYYAVFLNTEINEELRKEGLARELIRSVQQYRKELNLPVENRVNLTFDVS